MLILLRENDTSGALSVTASTRREFAMLVFWEMDVEVLDFLRAVSVNESKRSSSSLKSWCLRFNVTFEEAKLYKLYD